MYAFEGLRISKYLQVTKSILEGTQREPYEDNMETNYKFSKRSKDRLVGVEEDLVSVLSTAIQLSTVDFGIGEGLRSLERQKELLATGKSHTLNSRHLTGHAVDILCFVDGKLTWEPDYYIRAAEAIREASIDLDVSVRWGGAWTILGRSDSAREATDEYVAYKKAAGKRPFLDYVHFEIPE